MRGPRFAGDAPDRSFPALFPLRPFEQLLFGGLTFEERWRLVLGEVGFLGDAGEIELVVHPLSVPDLSLGRAIAAGAGSRRAWRAEGEIVAALLPVGRGASGRSGTLAELAVGCPAAEGEARVIRRPWDLIAGNAERIASDAALLASLRRVPGLPCVDGEGGAPPASRDLRAAGDGDVWVAKDARIEPFVFLDTSAGPVRIGARAVIEAGAVLRGPLWIRCDARVKSGARIGPGTTIGEGSRVGGEMEETVFGAFSNKQHEGFLGHACAGEWVNLGAGTNNSDLKNNYGAVRVDWGEGPTDTGLRKLGCFLGDHVKTAIGTRIGTGAVVGAVSNLFGRSGSVAGHIPSFTWGEEGEVYDLARAIETMDRVRGRRETELRRAGRTLASSPEERGRLEALWAGRKGRP